MSPRSFFSLPTTLFLAFWSTRPAVPGGGLNVDKDDTPFAPKLDASGVPWTVFHIPPDERDCGRRGTPNGVGLIERGWVLDTARGPAEYELRGLVDCVLLM